MNNWCPRCGNAECDCPEENIGLVILAVVFAVIGICVVSYVL